jgi:hypothetical protein
MKSFVFREQCTLQGRFEVFKAPNGAKFFLPECCYPSRRQHQARCCRARDAIRAQVFVLLASPALIR